MNNAIGPIYLMTLLSNSRLLQNDELASENHEMNKYVLKLRYNSTIKDLLPGYLHIFMPTCITSIMLSYHQSYTHKP